MKKVFILIRRSIYIGLGKINNVLNRGQENLIVLCYHSISDDNWRFSICQKEFEKQLDFLLSNYKIISLKTLYDYLNGRVILTKPSVVITFDDGYKDILSIATILKKLDIKPTVFVLSNNHHADRSQLHNNLNLLNKKDIILLKNLGWEIGSHSTSHQSFKKLKRDQIVNEVVESKKRLERELGFNINYFSYPKGRYSESSLLAAYMANYKLAVSMDNDKITKQSDSMKIPRIGVDKSHSLGEFKSMLTPTVIDFKKFAAKLGLNKFIL